MCLSHSINYGVSPRLLIVQLSLTWTLTTVSSNNYRKPELHVDVMKH